MRATRGIWVALALLSMPVMAAEPKSDNKPTGNGGAPVSAPSASANKGARAAAPQPPPPKDGSDGSLWSDVGYQSFLYYDRKAKKVGDLVTVKIVEASQATRSASTSLDRSSEISAGVDAMVGVEAKIIEKKPTIQPSALIGANTANSFKGDGATTRSGSITATVTARVVDVMPNGNLLILGQQEVKINNEIQVLSVRGLVRPQDIQINNLVLSTYIADSQIEYSGTGVVAEKQKPGWMSRAVDRVWPF